MVINSLLCESELQTKGIISFTMWLITVIVDILIARDQSHSVASVEKVGPIGDEQELKVVNVIYIYQPLDKWSLFEVSWYSLGCSSW